MIVALFGHHHSKSYQSSSCVSSSIAKIRRLISRRSFIQNFVCAHYFISSVGCLPIGTLTTNPTDIFFRSSFCHSISRNMATYHRDGWTKFTDLPTEIVRQYVPPLTSSSYKGSSGRVGILGGSERYTGAPYYAAMASLKAGSDLAFVFCAKEAAIPIKCYSPELMVSPVYSAEEFEKAYNEHHSNVQQSALVLVDSMVNQVCSMLDRMHVFIVGPGLGRHPLVLRATAEIIQRAMSIDLPLVIDADALFLLTQEPYKDILKAPTTNPNRIVVLTPNAVELKRLQDAVVNCSSEDERRRIEESYRGVICVEKGQYDRIFFFSSLFHGDNVSTTKSAMMVCQEEGGWKRSGGLGDILSGVTGTFLAWKKLVSASGTEELLPCWSACCIAKLATQAAFQKKRRAMTAPDVLEEIGPVIDQLLSSHFD